MEQINANTRLNQIPVLHVTGTHYVVGYTIGRQFKSMIDDLLNNWKYFNDIILPIYLTSAEGKRIYDTCLNLCQKKFPQYIQELEGMAEGAKVPFHKLFLLHIESIFPPSNSEITMEAYHRLETGCTTIMCNSDDIIIGHTEDACPEFLNNVYIICAEILDCKGEKVEKFSTLTYAGHLPGYTMGYNDHGMIYTVNTLFPKKIFPDRTPRTFIARALLGASNFVQVIDILRDCGCGVSDGFSLNIHFAKQEGAPVMHNVEIIPNDDDDPRKESGLSVLTLTHGDTHAHCNKYLRKKIEEQSGVGFDSSTHRHKAVSKHLKPITLEKIKEVLSDQSDDLYPVFRLGSSKNDFVKTVSVGIFDVVNRKWSIYLQPPNKSMPVVTLPMEF